MNCIRKFNIKWLLKIIVTCLFFQPTLIFATPAAQDVLRVYMGTPRKNGDSLFSITTEWRIDNALTYLSTGMLFLKGPDKDKSPSATKTAKKMVSAIRDSMVQLYPGWRGALPKQPPNQPEVIISNKEGFSFTAMTVKDYANQTLSYDMLDKSFAAAGVDVAIDLALAADVESLAGRTLVSAKDRYPDHRGEINITIGQQSISINTAGKTTRQLEQEIAGKLGGAQLSSSPIFPNIKDGDTRNNKPFDGSEVQFKHLPFETISIEITDPSLGVLTKFKFKDENQSHDLLNPATMVKYAGLALALGFGFVWYQRSRKQQTEGDAQE